jgi:hypothetical protein
MPTTIDSAGITFNDATSFTSAVLAANSVGATQITNGSVTASKLGTNEQKQICKAWVNFNGTTSPGTILSNYNVSSVTKNGTGDYTINFSTALADANYSVSGIANSGFGLSVGLAPNASYSSVTLKTTSQVRIITRDYASLQDPVNISIQVFGN